MAQHLRLEARGVIERKGTLIDATIVEAAITPWWGKTRRSRRATPRPVGPKNRKSPFGYKAHIAGGQGSGIIRGATCPAPTCMTARPDRPWSKAMTRPSMPTKPMTGNCETLWPQPGSPTASCTRPAEIPHSKPNGAGSTRRSRRSAPASNAAWQATFGRYAVPASEPLRPGDRPSTSSRRTRRFH